MNGRRTGQTYWRLSRWWQRMRCIWYWRSGEHGWRGTGLGGRCSLCLFWCGRFSFRYMWRRPNRATCWNVSRRLSRWRRSRLRGRGKSAFFDRLGMNREAEDLGKAFLHTIFERGCNVVDFGNRKAAVHRAVARDQDFVVDAADMNFVAIKQFVVFRLK